MIEDVITSAQNPRVKQMVLLGQKSSERRRQGLFVAEGRLEILHCLEAGLHVTQLYVCPELAAPEGDTEWEQIRRLCPADVTTTKVSPKVYEKMAYRGTTEGVMATVEARYKKLEELQLSEHPLLVVLERVEKPGNLGAVLRSADAAGADAVVVCDPLTDLYNPNLIRSSIGAIFTVPCVACSSEECINFMKQRGIQILTAQLQDSHLYYETPMLEGTAIVMGTEATGLTPVWRKAADAHIRIPMLGRLDSLNVSVSAAILLFEAVRQRQK
ncbi:MAG: RNA methyltransferase [Bacteroidaceae bacterium]|nr:RNA methyltransferase [Bacteroidaceae bacterium]